MAASGAGVGLVEEWLIYVIRRSLNRSPCLSTESLRQEEAVSG